MSEDALPPVCILAGGRGTRLGSITDDAPKPLVEVAGRPFIDWLLDQLRDEGFTHAVLLVGYRGGAIRAHVGDGARFGLSVRYSEDGPALIGTLGAVRKALPLVGLHVPVLYGDTYLEAPLRRVVEDHIESGADATMTVLHNRGAGDTSNAIVREGNVIAYGKNPPPAGAEWIDYGFSVLRRDLVAGSGQADLADLMSASAAEGGVGAWKVTQPFHEIGTPDALVRTEEFLRRNAVRRT
jgi:NDP-sugar pyrophosphorylase family protein